MPATWLCNQSTAGILLCAMKACHCNKTEAAWTNKKVHGGHFQKNRVEVNGPTLTGTDNWVRPASLNIITARCVLTGLTGCPGSLKRLQLTPDLNV